MILNTTQVFSDKSWCLGVGEMAEGVNEISVQI